MIAVHREYCLTNSPNLHAHFEVNPTGKLAVEIIELNQRHMTEFDDLVFQSNQGGIEVCGKEQRVPWRCHLAISDALELSTLVEEANEELEVLMRDLV
ncbi:hypothetical protein [Vibrio panuliri]|uniref:Uncharacterized protein n=1 Tax=Vibrio panuliri TaxID=1381081 RepID=A0A1Q9HP49_9VIBR|nr:hypothetical protein [Vibrio panuliri]KAB1455140.1 hypothetical protein F7O85_20070 [Vibrio panuliri]OLQ85296.1 hypothetical protein BIY20_16105 [Vibrio panuliri]OLQ92634.1 hypothetical protein BIY22_15010 [Vibrio panuliri]